MQFTRPYLLLEYSGEIGGEEVLLCHQKAVLFGSLFQ